MGIFNVFMPLIYGEGRENAFIRLNEEIYKRSRISSMEDQPNTRPEYDLFLKLTNDNQEKPQQFQSKRY